MIGPTRQGMQDLYDLDPTAYWDVATQTIMDSCAQWDDPCAAHSPRLVAIPVFDTEAYDAGKQQGLVTLRIANILGFFISGIQGNEVSGYFTFIPGLKVGDQGVLGEDSGFMKTILLVR
jgi:hypothetical protein